MIIDISNLSQYRPSKERRPCSRLKFTHLTLNALIDVGLYADSQALLTDALENFQMNFKKRLGNGRISRS